MNPQLRMREEKHEPQGNVMGLDKKVKELLAAIIKTKKAPYGY